MKIRPQHFFAALTDLSRLRILEALANSHSSIPPSPPYSLMSLIRYFPILVVALLLIPQNAVAQHSVAPGPSIAAEANSPTSPPEFRGGVTITQSELLEVTGGGVRCGNADLGYSTENYFYRVFDLSVEPEIVDGFSVNQVTAGIAIPTWPDEAPTQTGTIYLYNLTTPPAGGIIDSTALVEVGRADFDIVGPAGALFLQTVDISGSFADNDLLVATMFLPTGDPAVNEELPDVISMSQGGNEFGTTANEFLASASCGISNPQDITTLGDFTSQWSLAVTGTVGPVSNEDGAAVQSLTLGQNFPNPVVSGVTSIPFSLESAQDVTVAVFDALGREVSATAATYAAGEQSVQVDTRALPNGVYFYRINAGETTLTRKMVVMQ